MAPTLLGKKIENCFTSGPSIFDVVSGNLTAMEELLRRAAVILRSSFRANGPNYFAVDGVIANPKFTSS
jgi:hypothetical protein